MGADFGVVRGGDDGAPYPCGNPSRTRYSRLRARRARFGDAGVFIVDSIHIKSVLRLNILPDDGNGLNPILQDIGLALHPPMLYLGYVGLSVGLLLLLVRSCNRGRMRCGRLVRPWVCWHGRH